MNFTVSLLVGAVVATCSPHLCAELVAYQGFGGYADGALPGQATGALTFGLTAANITSAGAGANANGFDPTGLTFSNLVTQGGNGLFSDPTGRASYIGFGYNGPTVSGSLYTSYLVKFSTPQNAASAVSLRVNTASTAGGPSAYFQTFADSGNSPSTGSQYEGNNLNTTSAQTLPTATTFIVVGRFTHVGVPLSVVIPGQATTFVLTEAQFDHFKEGGFTDEELDAAAIGAGPASIISRVSDVPVTSGTFTLTSGNGIQFGAGNAAVNQVVAYDELRFGTALADVLPLEPVGPDPDPVDVVIVASGPLSHEPTAAGDAIGSFRLTREGDTADALRIYLSTSGTATKGIDYPEIPESVLIPAGSSTWVISVPAYTDRLVEGDETVTLSVTAGTGYNPPADPTASVTLIDRPAGEIATRSRFVQKLAAGLQQRIVVYGTSITANGAWSAQMKTVLDAAWPGQTTLINRGGSGMASDWGIENLTTRVLPEAPDAVFIEFSVNDAVARFDLSLAEARKNLEAIIDGIEASYPQCEIIIQVTNPVIGRPQGEAGWRPHLEHYQQLHRDIAGERGLLVIDHHPAWQALLDEGESEFLAYISDGLHPDAIGDETFFTPVLLRAIGAPPAPAPTVIVDDSEAELAGGWTSSTATAGAYQKSYHVDGNTGKGSKSATYTPEIPVAGTYPVYLRWTSATNRATNVPVTVNHSAGATRLVVNQTLNGGSWFKLGDFALNAGRASSIVIETTGTDGFVIADAVGVAMPSLMLRVDNGRLSEPGNLRSAVATIHRNGPVNEALEIRLSLGGEAVNGKDYELLPAVVTMPAGASSVKLDIIPKADEIFEGPESLTLEIIPPAGVATASPAKASITIVDPDDSPFTSWQRANFNADQLASPAISGPQADPDGDGLENLVEAFMGTLPLVSQVNPVTLGTSDVDLVLTYPRAPGTGLSGFPETSDDLISWRSGEAYLAVSADVEAGTFQQITARSLAPVRSRSRGFLRLRVTD